MCCEELGPASFPGSVTELRRRYYYYTIIIIITIVTIITTTIIIIMIIILRLRGCANSKQEGGNLGAGTEQTLVLEE